MAGIGSRETITVAFELLDALHPGRRDQDRQLEARLWLAEQIKMRANTNSLGRRFLDVEILSDTDTPGPSLAKFFFEPMTGTDVYSDTRHRQRLVQEFVEGLRNP